MEVIYTDAGFNQSAIINAIEQALENLPADEDEDGYDDPEDNCPDVYNPDQSDIDGDSSGDACDICDNANIFIIGNVNGDLDQEGLPNIDIVDVLALVDLILLGGDTGLLECAAEAGNVTGDVHVNVIDVIHLVQMILGGENVATRPTNLGAKGDQRLDKDRCLDRHMERPSDTGPGQWLLVGVLSAQSHQSRHLSLSNYDFFSTKIC